MEKSNTKSFPTIRTEKILMRQIVGADKENIFKGLSHPDIIKFYGISFQSLEATQAQMDWYASLEKHGTGIWWAVCSPDNTVFYGAGGLNDVNKTHCKAEIGFWLFPEFWGQGIMGHVIPLICWHGFEVLGLHRIEGFVETENLRCKNAMGKLDFQHEGTLRDCEIKNGKFISLDVYAKIINH